MSLGGGGGFFRVFWCFGAFLGGCFGALGANLRFWWGGGGDTPTLFLGPFCGILGFLGGSFNICGAIWGFWGDLGPFRSFFWGGIWGAFRFHLRPFLGLFWGHLRLFGGALGQGPFLGYFGWLLLVHFGAI